MKGNILGDIRAEQDITMLKSAFWETSDYKSLLETYDRPIIVGRRGTGKSAIAHKLSTHWSSKPKIQILKISPEEEQIIGLRDIFDLFGEKYLHIKAGTKMAWRYAIYMEIIVDILNHYKYSKNIDIAPIREHITSWGSRRISIATKIRKKLKSILETESTPQSRIADLSDALELELVEEVLFEALESNDIRYVVFADRLDEGYSPDNLGVAIVDGFIQSAIDIKSRLSERVITFAFVRDNIYRAIAKLDPDFTRNIEGQTLRLHWDEYNLFNLVCNRMRVAFNDKTEKSVRLWNKYTANELRGIEGFRTALKLTLYRPRDILVLLNEAFLRANSRERKEIILEDIETTSKSISINRLSDLHKEYEYIFPSLELFTSTFHGSSSEISFEDCKKLLSPILKEDHLEKDKQQDIFLFENSTQVIQRLYSIGFLGLYNIKTSSFIFCHDGKDPDRELSTSSRLLIHPCYWLALATQQSELKLAEAEDIHDEYDIEVTSEDNEHRYKRIEALIQELNTIEEGRSGAHDFESWVEKVVKILFASTLWNVEAHPNRNGLQQRDIVATNHGETKFWNRVLSDYNTRQVIFEVKNYQELKASDYRQLNGYLTGQHGQIGFFITRDHNNNLERDRDLQWAKEIYFEHKKIIIKISHKFLEKHLRKARSPQKHDAMDKELNNLIDTYIRQYLITKSR